jgi:uncharacterized protein (DUF362 family)
MTDRRRFLGSVAAATATGAAYWNLFAPRYGRSYRKAHSKVAILGASQYSDQLEPLLMHALQLFDLPLKNRAVLLKPNLVENLPGAPVNTHPTLVGAAATCFLRLGVRQVVVAEGPGHERDTELILSETDFAQELRGRGIEFVDLNRDELAEVTLRANYSGLRRLWLPTTVLKSDFIVSMPKVKTHHWAGVTLSMKNMFGIVPGMKYGWPKNTLHWHGIHESILDICATVPISFVIADGIEAMEGNGPLQGELRRLGRIVLSDDPVAADATCARLMGLNPASVPHIGEGGKFLGNLDENRLLMLGEHPQRTQVPFRLLPEFRYLRAE